MHWRKPGALDSLLHKLYISPRLEAVPQLFPRLIDVFVSLDVPAFKVGATSRGLLRPDKIVTYFANHDHLQAVADELSAVPPVSVHGVPFSVPLDATGLLSWGYDPATKDGSWRQWVAQRLTVAVKQAEGSSLHGIVEQARRHLRDAGVDPYTWVPLPGV
jgi:hypothetical protein